MEKLNYRYGAERAAKIRISMSRGARDPFNTKHTASFTHFSPFYQSYYKLQPIISFIERDQISINHSINHSFHKNSAKQINHRRCNEISPPHGHIPRICQRNRECCACRWEEKEEVLFVNSTHMFQQNTSDTQMFFSFTVVDSVSLKRLFLSYGLNCHKN